MTHAMSGSLSREEFGKITSPPLRNITKSPFVSRPIYSYGFIVKAADTGRWLLVRKLYTVEYQLLMRGSFRLANLPFLLGSISAEERNILGMCCMDGNTDGPLLEQIINTMFPHVDGEIRKYAMNRIMEASVHIHRILTNISNTGSKEWLWPKGQQKPGEDPIKCARREFYEEVGQHLPEVMRNAPFQLREKIVTTTGRQFESTYWICLIAKEFPLIQPQRSETEIGERRWVTDDEALELLNNKRQEIFMEAKKWADDKQGEK